MGKKLIDLTPDWVGAWFRRNDFGIFGMWKEEKDSGKIWEYNSGTLIELTFKDFVYKKEGRETVSFIKQYPKIGNFGYFVIKDHDKNHFRGTWFKDEDKKVAIGDCYLTNDRLVLDDLNLLKFENKGQKELASRIGEYYLKKFHESLREEQKEFPFTPLIPTD